MSPKAVANRIKVRGCAMRAAQRACEPRGCARTELRVRPGRANSPRACRGCAGTARCARLLRRCAAPRQLRPTRATPPDVGAALRRRAAAPGVREAVPRRERLQVPHHQREPPAPGAPLLRPRRAVRRAALTPPRRAFCTPDGHLRPEPAQGGGQLLAAVRARFLGAPGDEVRPAAPQLQGLRPRRAADASARSHRNTRVAAQLVYNEYIANKTHIHMNGAPC